MIMIERYSRAHLLAVLASLAGKEHHKKGMEYELYWPLQLPKAPDP